MVLRLAAPEKKICYTADQYKNFETVHPVGAAYQDESTMGLLRLSKNNIALVLFKTAIKSGKMSREAVSEFCSGHIAFKMTLGETVVRGLLLTRKYAISICWHRKKEACG